MKKEITVRDFYKVLEGTVYEKNYGLILNAISHHEGVMYSNHKDDCISRQFKENSDKIFYFLLNKGYYDVD